MFCGSCGAKTLPGENFCRNCGVRLNQNPEMPEINFAKPEMPNEFGTTVEMDRPTNSVNSTNPFVKAVKSVAGSPVFLIAAIAFSVQILFSVIDAFMHRNIGSYVYNLLRMLEQYTDIPGEAYDAVRALDTIGTASITAGKLVALIPSLLICLGLWLIYTSAKDKNFYRMKTTGFTIIKVIQVISLVGICISALAVLVLLIIGISALAAYEVSEGIVAVAISFVVFAIVYFLLIFYMAKIIKTINVAKKAALGEVSDKKASVFIGVMCFISAVLCLFSLLTSFFISLTEIVYLICFGIAIFNFNKAMTAAKYSGIM